MIKNRIISILLVLMLPTAVNAANWYKVELLVFENLGPDYSGEVWDVQHEYPDLQRSVEIITAIPGDEDGLIAFKGLNAAAKKLSGIYASLKSSSEYRPIMHTGWQQPAMNGNNARSVHIKLEDQFKTRLDGSVRIRSGHYLYIDIDLAYFHGLSAGSEAEKLNSNAAFTLMNETRKVKLNEIHYFDHPLFGLVMRVSRL